MVTIMENSKIVSILLISNLRYVEHILRDMEKEGKLLLKFISKNSFDGIYILEQNISEIDLILMDFNSKSKYSYDFLSIKSKFKINVPVIAFANENIDIANLNIANFIKVAERQTVTSLANFKSVLNLYIEMIYPSLKKREIGHKFQVAEETTKLGEEKSKLDLKSFYKNNRISIICIGVSTGGPSALRVLINGLGDNIDYFPPVLIAQHIPSGFSGILMDMLGKVSKLQVIKPASGEIPLPNKIYITPGNGYMILAKTRDGVRFEVEENSLKKSFNPCINMLFNSAAALYGSKVLSLLMTGMGEDGVDGVKSVFNAGGITLGQNEKTSIIYGMAKVAKNKGYIIKELGLQDMTRFINGLIKSDKSERLNMLFN